MEKSREKQTIKKKKSLEPSCEETGLNQSLQQSLLVWRTSEMPEKPRTIHYGLFPSQHALVGSGTKGFVHLANVYVVIPMCEKLCGNGV